MRKQIATFVFSATLALLLYPLSLSSQNTFSLSLDADSAAGDQAVTSVNTSADQDVSIQVFGSTIQNATAFGLSFEYDDAQVTYQGFDAGSVLPGTPMYCRQNTARIRPLSKLAWRLWGSRPRLIMVWWAQYAFARQPHFRVLRFRWFRVN